MTTKDFFFKSGSVNFVPYGALTSCKKLEKTNGMSLRYSKMDSPTEGLTDQLMDQRTDRGDYLGTLWLNRGPKWVYWSEQTSMRNLNKKNIATYMSVNIQSPISRNDVLCARFFIIFPRITYHTFNISTKFFLSVLIKWLPGIIYFFHRIT